MQADKHASRRILSSALALGAVSALAFGCTRDQRAAGTDQPAPRPSDPTAMPTVPPTNAPGTMSPHGGAMDDPGAMTAQPSAPAAGEGLSGTVVETMDAGGYTYAKLDRGTVQVWVAGPETKLTVGTKIGTVTGTLMSGFRSETLKRTFDEIYFINSFAIEGTAPANPHTGAGTPAAALVEKVAPLAGSQTIASVYADKDKLVGKPVVLHAKIVKLNNGILGRNWLHVQDGSGTTGTNDLTVTTPTSAPAAAIGDIVVVRGTLAADKDFGGGYTYKVLIEDATLSAK